MENKQGNERKWTRLSTYFAWRLKERKETNLFLSSWNQKKQPSNSQTYTPLCLTLAHLFAKSPQNVFESKTKGKKMKAIFHIFPKLPRVWSPGLGSFQAFFFMLPFLFPQVYSTYEGQNQFMVDSRWPSTFFLPILVLKNLTVLNMQVSICRNKQQKKETNPSSLSVTFFFIFPNPSSYSTTL